MRYYSTLFLWLVFAQLHAQEFRGGEISFVRTDETHYDAFIDVYYKGDVTAPKPFLRFYISFWMVDTAELVSMDTLALDYYRLRYKESIYIFEENTPFNFIVLDTFPLPTLKNLDGDKRDFFTLYTMFFTPYTQWLGLNSPPIFDFDPTTFHIDDGVFTFDSKATDPDGDSLVYALKDYNNPNHPEYYIYTLPVASDTFSCDSLQGIITWDKPLEPGKYLFGVLVNSTYFGSSQRDIIVEIREEDLSTRTKEDELLSSTFTLYPNPASQKLRLDIVPTPDWKGSGTLTGWDMLGKLVYFKTLPNVDVYFSEEVDVSHWKPGVYCFVLTVNGRVKTERIVVE